MYVWVDGIHLKIRLDEAKASGLVLMGVRADGTMELASNAVGSSNAQRLTQPELPQLIDCS